MSNIQLKVDIKDKISGQLKKIKQKLANLPKEAYQEFKDITPVRSGNAKRNTVLQGNTIHASYPYASVLDKGRHRTRRGMRGSEQAPIGMTKPTQEFVKKRIKRILQGK